MSQISQCVCSGLSDASLDDHQRTSLKSDIFQDPKAPCPLPYTHNLSTENLIRKRHQDGNSVGCTYRQRLVAFWKLCRSSCILLAIVISLQLAFGIWQCYEYSTNHADQAALGWGVGLAKGCAGALYPTLLFLLLSMSRWLSTAMRNYEFMSDWVNWDNHRYFHIRMAIAAFILASLHGVGHLTGSFVHASSERHHDAAARLLSDKINGYSYIDFVRSLPGWTGLTSYMLFLTICILSTPYIRRISFETFQIAHFLVFPMLVLLIAHGTTMLLQYPVLGFIIGIPLAILLIEKISRFISLHRDYPARIEVIDSDTVCVSIMAARNYRHWKSCRAGQYILVCVPSVSTLQWHPFTIARKSGNELSIYMKNSGTWTQNLRLCSEFEKVHVDGPFGAPAQCFWEYEDCIIIGMGVGLTPSSSLLDELLSNSAHAWSTNARNSEKYQQMSSSSAVFRPRRYRLSMYWVVRSLAKTAWLIPTLQAAASCPYNSDIAMEADIFVTRPEALSDEHSKTAIALQRLSNDNAVVEQEAYLKTQTHLGSRPNFARLLEDRYEELKQQRLNWVVASGEPLKPRLVGVFFCGTREMKAAVRNACFDVTLKSVGEQSDIAFHFHPEIF